MVALVTGAGRRLGRRIALALARAGFDIVVHYRDSEAGAQETAERVQGLGRRALPVYADISVQEEIEPLVELAWAKFQGINILVNNAGVYARSGWESVSVAEWQHMVETNLIGTFLMSQAIARRMKSSKGGRIVNIASIGGLQAWPRHIPYSVSKAGVIWLTRGLARALAPDITVNAVAPGTVIMDGEEEPTISHLPPALIPLGRYGTSRDITDVVTFLALCGRYVTGQVFPIDGGRSIDLLPA
jgi:3-oxoacyl-[acyl-carrier protein] reductase